MKRSMIMKGIDVSKHQKVIDWKQVKSAGIKFAMIRAGYGVNSMDEYFQRNIKGALENDIAVGVYWFVYARNEAEAIKNAQMFDAVIKGFKNKITLKTWCDYEYDTDRYSRDSGISPTRESRTKIVRAFCDKMRELGYEAGVYAHPDYLKNYFGDLKKYPLWLAHYTTETDKYCDCEIWQYTSKGKIAGINGNVDMNYIYMDIKEDKSIEALAKEVIQGLWGTGTERKKALEKAGYDYEKVQAKVNKLLAPKYYPKYTGNSIFLDTVLKTIGVPDSMRGNAKKRLVLANANGIYNYTGTYKQNRELIALAKQGKLKKPV